MTRPHEILTYLMNTPAQKLSELPTECGVYALYNEKGKVRYIGVTEMGIRRRVWQYHCAGDSNSHKFSTIFNAGRLYHDPLNTDCNTQDGKTSKNLRALFARYAGRAVGFSLPGLTKTELLSVENEVISMAPAEALAWNKARRLEAYEPTLELDTFIQVLAWPAVRIEAVERQAEVWKKVMTPAFGS